LAGGLRRAFSVTIARGKRLRPLFLIAIVGLIAGLAIANEKAYSANRAASSGIGPVSHRLLLFLNSHGPMEFRAAGTRARARITRAVAIKDALHDARWHTASISGISLVRFAHRTGDIPAGTLGWLANVRPREPIYDGGKASPEPAGNYFVVAIRARDGRFLAAEDGYSAALANRSGRGGWSTGEFA
jgi:hypothetical protein